ETTSEGRRLVEDFYTTVKSSLKPGMGPMAGVGAAAGRAASSAVLSGGIGLATERSQGVDGDAKHTAEQITQTLKKFFIEQGWIAPCGFSRSLSCSRPRGRAPSRRRSSPFSVRANRSPS